MESVLFNVYQVVKKLDSLGKKAAYCNIVPGVASAQDGKVNVAGWKIVCNTGEELYLGMRTAEELDKGLIESFTPINERGMVLEFIEDGVSLVLTEYELSFKKNFERENKFMIGLKKLGPIMVSTRF